MNRIAQSGGEAMKKVFSRWYVSHEGQVHGPVDADAVRGAFEAGRLTVATLVCREGETTWIELKDVSAFHGPGAGAHPAQTPFDPRSNSVEMMDEEAETLRPPPSGHGAQMSTPGPAVGPGGTTRKPASSTKMMLVIAVAIILPTAGFCVVGAFAWGASSSGTSTASPQALTGCWLAQNPSLHICLNGDGSFQSRLPDGRRGAGTWGLTDGMLALNATTGPTAGSPTAFRVVSVDEQALTLVQDDLRAEFTRAEPIPVPVTIEGCWETASRLRECFHPGGQYELWMPRIGRGGGTWSVSGTSLHLSLSSGIQGTWIIQELTNDSLSLSREGTTTTYSRVGADVPPPDVQVDPVAGCWRSLPSGMAIECYAPTGRYARESVIASTTGVWRRDGSHIVVATGSRTNRYLVTVTGEEATFVGEGGTYRFNRVSNLSSQ